MNIYDRVINAYKAGGIKEITRKTFFHYIYRVHNYYTRHKVNKSAMEYGLYKGAERDYQVVVSLTSYPARFSKICDCLKSITLQKTKPDKIIVYLGSDTKESDLTPEMIKYQEYGVEYRFDKEKNLKAHKKYYYAMQDFPNAVIVTADDDLYYPTDWLDSLLLSYQKYPYAISARRVHLMHMKSGKIAQYNSWKDQWRKEKKPSFSLFATGGSGALYPPHCLKKSTFDVDKIISLSLNADDIWLKCMSVISGVPVVWVPNNEVDQLSVDATNNDMALSKINVDEEQNSIYMENVCSAFGIKAKDFFKKVVG